MVGLRSSQQSKILRYTMEDLQRLVEHVFTGEPKPEQSVQLQLSDDSDITDDSDLQKVLATITYVGANKLFGVEKCEDLTQEQQCLLQLYLRSMGYEMVAKCMFPDANQRDGRGETDQNPWVTEDFQDVKISYRLLS